MKVKICGMTHPADAEYAALSGADYIGIIFSDISKHKVSLPLAQDIAYAARQAGAEPIGVFIDETASQIALICEKTGIHWIQLHGPIPQQDLPLLLGHYSIIYTLSVQKNGSLSHPMELPDSMTLLYDTLKGGTGIPFDWKTFSPPTNRCWILAGGLNPNNVEEAITLLQPHGVDVASGVEFPHTIRKDPALVKAFIQTAKQLKEKL